MKKVLYITNIEVPYKVRIFNELAKTCELTVLYERKRSKNRNDAWAHSEQCRFKTEYLEGIKVKNEYSFSLRLIPMLLAGYDVVVFSCYDSPVQAMGILLMRLLRKRYILSTDGEVFAQGKGIKSRIKRFVLRGATAYLTAGEKAAATLRGIVKRAEVYPYFFSSMTNEEIVKNVEFAHKQRDKTILAVGQYYDYKGLDTVIQAAKLDDTIQYKIVGVGSRAEQLIQEQGINELHNVKVIPFLPKADLEREYQKCAMLVLPSRQECWGLVVNEAASFGMPIVSTWGSGAAVEFLKDAHPEHLVNADDPEALLSAIRRVLNEDCRQYSEDLLTKSKQYSVEIVAKAHQSVFEEFN